MRNDRIVGNKFIDCLSGNNFSFQTNTWQNKKKSNIKCKLTEELEKKMKKKKKLISVHNKSSNKNSSRGEKAFE